MDEHREANYPEKRERTDEADPDVLNILLELPGEPAKAEKSIKLTRLSAETGRNVCFKIRSLGYDRAAAIVKDHPDNISLFVVLEGCVEPSFKNEALRQHYGAATPAELIKKMLLPGEIEDISREVQRLSGYLAVTYEVVEKK